MNNKLALIMTMSLFLSSVSPAHIAGAEVVEPEMIDAETIEIAEEESAWVSVSEDAEDPEPEIVEDPETVSDAELSEEEGIGEELFAEDSSLTDIPGLIEEDDPADEQFLEVFTTEPEHVGDAADSWGRAEQGDLLFAASEADGTEYYGSQLSGLAKTMYEVLKTGTWEYDAAESVYKIMYTFSEPYICTSETDKISDSAQYQEFNTALFSAFDAYLYDYPEEAFWFNQRGTRPSFYKSQDSSTGQYRFSIVELELYAIERWTGAKAELEQLRTYTNGSVSEIQAVDGYASMTVGEKLKAVHDHLCRQVKYGHAETTIPREHTPFGAYYQDHEVVCEGYAKLYKILVDKLGITSNVLVSGQAVSSDGSGGAHMWNAVQLNGSWYLLDATWDDQDKSSTIYYDYFLAGSGSYGFDSSLTVGGEHEAEAHFSSSGGAFATPQLAGIMYHQEKQTAVTPATCTQDGGATVVCGLHTRMSRGSEAAPRTVVLPGGHKAVTDPAVAATCTESGLTEGSHCSVCGEVLTAQNPVAATGHKWGIHAWDWTGYSSAKASFVCENDPSHTAEKAAVITKNTTPATCEQDGSTVYTATAAFEGKEYTDTKTAVIPKTGHTWKAPEFTWAADNNSAKALFVCEKDANHKEEIDAVITANTTPATCEADGSTVYTATVNFEGKEYTDTRTDVLQKTGHTWKAPQFTWAADYSSAKALFVCEKDASHKKEIEAAVTVNTTAATCEQEGETVYTATATFGGKEYTDTKTVKIPQSGHTWKAPQFTWAADNSSAKALFVCEKDANHKEEIDAVITANTTQAACEQEGETVYTATVTFEGKEYTDTKTVKIPQSGHTWKAPEFTWAADYSSAKAVFVCEKDASHKKEIEAAVTVNTTPATCEADGSTVYTATATFEGKEYTDTRTDVLQKTGHTWKAPQFTWAADYSSAKALFVCEKDANHKEEIDAVITVNTTQATCEENGKTVYTATATFEGAEYTDTRTVEIPKTGHQYGTPVWEWAEDYSTAKLIFTCQHDDTHQKVLDGEVTTKITKEATYKETGIKTHTARAVYDGTTYSEEKTETIPKLPANGTADEGLSWAVADGVLTVGLQKGAATGSMPDYTAQQDAPWKKAAAELGVEKIVVEEGITSIGSNAFTTLQSITEMTLPQSLETISGESVESSVLESVQIYYGGSNSQWNTLTQGTVFQNASMTSVHEHSWDSGEVTVPATTTSEGVRTYRCACGETKTETIPKLSPSDDNPQVNPGTDAAPEVIAEQITISKKPTIKKPSATKNKITVNWKHFKKTKKTQSIWKKIKKVQIQCATDKAFTNIVKTTTVGKSKTKATIKGLAKKTNYYVRVRYFDGTGYSKWSSVKKIKTKK